MNTALEMIPFPPTNQTIWAGRNGEDSPVVALRPICTNIGLGWGSQRQRIKSDPILSEGVTMVVTPSQGGMQDTVCLPLDLIPGWLFKIDSRRVKPAIRDRLIAYQRECHRVLAGHFGVGRAAPERPQPYPQTPPDAARDMPILELQARLSMVREARLLRGAKAAMALWDELGLPSLPQDDDHNPMLEFRDQMLVRDAASSIPFDDLTERFNQWNKGGRKIDNRAMGKLVRGAGIEPGQFRTENGGKAKGLKGWRFRDRQDGDVPPSGEG